MTQFGYRVSYCRSLTAAGWKAVVHLEEFTSMIARIPTLTSVVLLMILAGGCGGQRDFRKPTYPVTGVVLVDGSPAPEVQVVLNDVKGIDQMSPTFSQTFTDQEGRFSVSTYEKGDGVPEGEYALTFSWRSINAFSMQYSGDDKLKEKYTDPTKSPYKIKVEKGKPANLGRIELTTQ